jgi:hypothetical protein
MAFNVLKDPKDPRNFIVQPVPTAGADPSLLAAGQAAGQAGTLARPKRRASEGFQSTAPGTGQTQFGPGSEEAFARGLLNFRGRLNRKRFEQNKTVFEANLVRDGLNINAPGVRQALNEAYKSTNGFAAATDVAQDFFFNQPEQEQQRAVDLKALQDKQQRDATQQKATITNLKNENEVFRVTQGVPMAQYTEDRTGFFENMRLADRVRDIQTLNERVGVMRGPRFTDAERAAVQTAYDDGVLQLTIAVSQANQAGALSDAEFERFSRFLPDFSTTAPLQDSTRRVTLGNAFNIFKGAANDIWNGDRGLQKGSEAVNFDRDIGKKKTWEEILFLAAGQPGDIDVTDRLAEARADAGATQARATAAAESVATVKDITGGPSFLFPGAPGISGEEEIEAIKKVGRGIADFLLPAAGGR